jgi:hypothetical protein
MMPVVRISDATMQKLQPLAIPLQDSIDTLLNRLADAAHSGVPYKLPVSPVLTSTSKQSTPIPWYVASHDDLTFTRLISAEFDGMTLPKANWNTLAKYAHEAAFQKLGSFDALRLSTRARVRQGRYEMEGFVYLPTVDISLQGMDANMSWDNSVRLAHAIGVPVSVVFEWRNNPKAAKPGQKSHLDFLP